MIFGRYHAKKRGQALRYIFLTKKLKRMPLQSLTQYAKV